MSSVWCFLILGILNLDLLTLAIPTVWFTNPLLYNHQHFKIIFDIPRPEIIDCDIIISPTSIYEMGKFNYTFAKSIYRDSFVYLRRLFTNLYFRNLFIGIYSDGKNVTSHNFSIGCEKLLGIYSSLKRGLDSLFV